MNKSVKATMIIAGVVGAIAFFGGGVLVGAAVAGVDSRVSAAERGPKPVPCNLTMTWDRASQSFSAGYDESAFVSSTPEYGRIANLSCSDGEILAWQTQRRADGLDDEVCRPVLSDGVDGAVRVVGCAFPVVVDDDAR
ncbi:hypothetical protein DY023_04045 [Microbacterium bovistercoris]|uniref:Uncharacterized protein n=1 Tax=Microbacterium bovistercoris TaxID=2293570 RepID=A0A371NXF9_9MICO|nr:hypothetical protein [Microbacterium bovistercoris]REJ07378.1 hypothetical protein DY023_04045 [Microbacterium bovistercoris]